MQCVLITFISSHPTPHRSTPFPYPVSFVFSLCQDQFMLLIYSWTYESVVHSPGVTVNENWLSFFFSEQLSKATILSARMKLCLPPLSMLGLSLAWTLTGFMYLITAAMSSYVQPPSCVWKTQFPCSHPMPLTFVLFPHPLLQWFLNLGRWGCGIDGPLRNENPKSVFLCMLTSVCLCTNH